MTNFKYNRWLIGFIIIGLIAALYVGWHRHMVERNNMSVELVLDYEDVVELARIEGVPTTTVLEKLKEAGISSLAVYETTLKKLGESGKAATVSGSAILNSYHSGLLTEQNWCQLVEQGLIVPENIYVICNDELTFEEVKADFVRRMSEERVQVIQAGAVKVISAKASSDKAMKWNLGLSTEEMRAVNEAGFYIVARPSNYHAVTEDDVAAVFSRLNDFKVSGVIFSGDEVLGYPEHITETAEAFKAKGITLGLIEHPQQLQFFKQEGLIELAEKNNYKAARVYSIPKDEQVKMKVNQAVERLILTDEERNVRIDLMRIFEKPENGKSLIDTNLGYVENVKEGLQEKGFTVGRAGTYVLYYPEKLCLILLTIGAVAAGVLYLSLIVPMRSRYQYILLAVISAILVTPLLLGKGAMVRSVVALASANLFPALAVIWQMDRWRSGKFSSDTPLVKMMLAGAVALIATGFLSFIGGAYVASVLADVEYFLEIHIFRGVKLTFVLPILLVTVAYLRRFNLFGGADYSGDLIGQVKKILDCPVYIKSLILFGIAAVGALIFIGRSGHTMGVPVPAIELKLRAFLEQVFYARPRSKELFIGHPAFMLAVMAVYKKWPNILFFVLVIVATIGQGSLVETFAHLRTPVFMSFMRGLGGLVLGAGVGMIAMFFAHLLYNLSSYVGRGTTKDE